MSDILRYKAVKIRKPHVCFGCGRKFLPPATMYFEAYADDGTVYSTYICKTCDEIAGNEEFGFSELRDEAIEMEAGNERKIHE